jgi:hypothetical protein
VKNLSKCFQISSPEKVSMPKTHWGSVIGDKFYHGEKVGDDPSRFSLVPMKRVGVLTIDNIFSLFINVCPSPLLPMPKGNQLSMIYLCKS